MGKFKFSQLLTWSAKWFMWAMILKLNKTFYFMTSIPLLATLLKWLRYIWMLSPLCKSRQWCPILNCSCTIISYHFTRQGYFIEFLVSLFVSLQFGNFSIFPKWYFWTRAWNLKFLLTKSILLEHYENWTPGRIN